jgi:hypothetical protein
MTAAVWVIVMSVFTVGLAYVIGDVCGQARGHARGYAAGQRDGRRAMYQTNGDGLRKQAREAEEAIERLYMQARDQIRQHESNRSGGRHE